MPPAKPHSHRCLGYRAPRDDSSAGNGTSAVSPQARRLENRFPGVDANPYLAIAASLACGYLGMKKKIKPSEPHPGDAFLEPITVARNLQTALGLLEECEDLKNAMGNRFVRAYCAVKREEFEAFNKVISSWEREYLLLNV